MLPNRSADVRNYCLAFLLLLASTLVGWALRAWVQPHNLVIIYLLGVVISAVLLGRGPSIGLTIISMLVFDYFFVPPLLTFKVEDEEYLITFVGFLIVGLVISQLTLQTKKQSEKMKQLAEQARQAQLMRATELLQTALLNSISHDLRTPLVSITGVLSSLKDDRAIIGDENHRSLVETAYEEAERLNWLVGNLLDMTRVQSGAIRVHHEPCDIQDVIGSALEQLEKRLGDHPIIVHVPDQLQLVPMDFVMVVQALVNLIDNAVKYSGPDAPVEIKAEAKENYLEIEVCDRGIGISAEDLPHIFDKFYRGQHRDRISGIGLGLTVSRGMVAAHGGYLDVYHRDGGGMVFRMKLPLIECTLELTGNAHD